MTSVKKALQENLNLVQQKIASKGTTTLGATSGKNKNKRSFETFDISMVENTPNDNYNLQNKKFKTVTMTYDFKKEFELKNIDEEEDDDEKYFKEYSNKHDDGQYAKTIYKKKFQDEKSLILQNPIFGILQTEIDPPSYAILLGLLFDVYQDQRLHPSTLILAMHILDRLLSNFHVKKTSFLLVGASCLTLASKLEEIYPVCVTSLLNTMKHLFTREELFSMEKRIFMKLHFNLSFPTRYQFGIYFAHHLHFNNKQNQLLLYFLLLSFLDYNLNYISMSQAAAAACYLVLQLTTPSQQETLWTEKLSKIFQCSEADLFDPFLRLRKLHYCAQEVTAISNIIDYFKVEERESVSAIHSLHYTDIRITSKEIYLPARERDYRFVEKAIIINNNPSNTTGNNNHNNNNQQMKLASVKPPVPISTKNSLQLAKKNSNSSLSSSTSSSSSSSSSSTNMTMEMYPFIPEK